MCRNIMMLFNFDPPATEDEIHACALQYVRKVSGMRAPSMGNKATYDAALAQVEAATRTLVRQLITVAPPRNREDQKRKARARGEQREARLRAKILQGSA